MPNSLSTVLLDAGGVILEEREQEARRAEVVAEVVQSVKPEYSVDHYWSDIDEALARYSPRLYEYVVWKNTAPDRALFERLNTEHRRCFLEQRPALELMEGIAQEIKSLARDFDLVVAGQYGRDVMDLLAEHGLESCFRTQLTQDDFAITKPDPRYLEQIASIVGRAPQECIMVGDRLDNDIVPAKLLGMKAIRIRTGLHRVHEPRIPWEEPDVTLPSVIGLAAAARRLAAAAG